MNAQYIAVWKLHGANSLVSASNDVELAQLSNPKVVIRITADPERYFARIDEAAVLANRLINRIAGIPGGRQKQTTEEAFIADLAKMKSYRSKQTSSGVFLVFDGETEVSSPNLKSCQDCEGYTVCVDAFDKTKITNLFRAPSQTVLTALALSLAANADREMERVGEIVYLVDPDNPKPIYSLSLKGQAPRLSLASPINDSVISGAARRIPVLGADRKLARVIDLLNTSLDRKTDELSAFIAAWAALEMFANTAFKNTYESRWSDILRNGTPISAYVASRLKEVVNNRYRLTDKFLIVAEVLGVGSIRSDDEGFHNLKNIRDGLLHGLESPEHLPKEAVQNLLFKYLSLHLDGLQS